MKFPSMPRKGVPVENTVRDIINFLRSSRLSNVTGGRVKVSANGTTLDIRPGKGVVSARTALAGAFWTQYTDTGGDTYLQCGTVTGGNGGSATITDEKVLDFTTGVGTNSGKILYLKATCEATVTDGVMQPGCLLTAAVLVTGTSLPTNHTFTKTAKTGDIHMEVGRWTDSVFLPSGPPGNFLASGCIGDFSLSKIAE